MLVLLLCLVGVVAGKLVNIAPNGTISASSVGWGGVPQRAVDGDTNGYWRGGSCFHSRNARNDKLFLSLPGGDFGVKYPIDSISVFNRQDSCCGHRLQGMEIWADNHMCGALTYKAGQQEYSVDCKKKEASVVTIFHPTQYLQVCELRVFVDDSFKPDLPDYINVAINGTASASSVGWGGVPTRVNDGNNNGYWGGRSCYHSRDASPSRVSVTLPAADLGVKYPVSKIRVWNRLDTCCDQRLAGAMVYADEKECGRIEFKEGVRSYMIDCGEHKAGEVSVRHQGQSLQVCELEALVLEENMPTNIPKYTNVALGRPAVQSSMGWGGAPQRAVDGNTNKMWSGRSCTHTSRTTGNWWTVQLDSEQYVGKVVIHNRIDCCSARIGGAKVWVGSGSKYEHCGTVSYNANNSPVIVVECNTYGDSIKITNDNSYLTLCEVEVLVPEEIPSEEIDEERGVDV